MRKGPTVEAAGCAEEQNEMNVVGGREVSQEEEETTQRSSDLPTPGRPKGQEGFVPLSHPLSSAVRPAAVGAVPQRALPRRPQGILRARPHTQLCPEPPERPALQH
ncbi:unnamed protein product [Rangifer tarandus platyrhynchus]|uniref:Uncharacterized protein n=1 Tax=Rangifer tarandus platyrhynchus TaxID=3082113 RepID=A0AC59Y4B7_RANTA